MLGTMSTSPLGLIRPKPRKFEDLAREEMRRQQLLLSNRSHNEMENSKPMDESQSQRLNHSRIGQAKVAPDATDQPSSFKKIAKEVQAPIEPVDGSSADLVHGAVSTQSSGSSDTSCNNNLFFNLPRNNVPFARNFRSDDEDPTQTSPPSRWSSKSKTLKGEIIKLSESNIGDVCGAVPYFPKAGTFDGHNKTIQRSASLSLSSDDGDVQEHHRHVKQWTINLSKNDSLALEAMQTLNFQHNYNSSLVDAMIFPTISKKLDGHFSPTAKAPKTVDLELNADDHDSECTNSEKYVSSDTDNDDASTITRSSGGNEASSEAVGVEDEDEENCDCHDGGESYDEDIRSDERSKQLANSVEGNHLQQALKRLAILSRSAHNTLSKSIISKTWFSSDSYNGANTPSSSLPPARFGSFTGDSDSLRYSSMDSFTSAVNNSNHSSFVASGIFGFIGNVTSNSSVATYSSSDVAANAEVPPLLLSNYFSGNNHASSSVRVPSEGGHHTLSRDVEKQLHSQFVSTVPPNLPRSKNRTCSHSDQPESSMQPKYILIGKGKKKGWYGSLESNRRSPAEEEVFKNNRLVEPSEKSALIETRSDFNRYEEYKIKVSEETAIASAEDTTTMGQEMYTFHTYFWRGVVIMSVTCIFILLLNFLLERGLF